VLAELEWKFRFLLWVMNAVNVIIAYEYKHCEYTDKLNGAVFAQSTFVAVQ
jgi:hypothetical protein